MCFGPLNYLAYKKYETFYNPESTSTITRATHTWKKNIVLTLLVGAWTKAIHTHNPPISVSPTLTDNTHTHSLSLTFSYSRGGY